MACGGGGVKVEIVQGSLRNIYIKVLRIMTRVETSFLNIKRRQDLFPNYEMGVKSSFLIKL